MDMHHYKDYKKGERLERGFEVWEFRLGGSCRRGTPDFG